MTDEPLAQITYSRHATLKVPTPTKSILVRIKAAPEHASYIIYGWDKNGQLLRVQASGSHDELELPFVKPDIYIKYLKGLESFTLGTVGFQMDFGT